MPRARTSVSSKQTRAKLAVESRFPELLAIAKQLGEDNYSKLDLDDFVRGWVLHIVDFGMWSDKGLIKLVDCVIEHAPMYVARTVPMQIDREISRLRFFLEHGHMEGDDVADRSCSTCARAGKKAA